MKTYFYSVIFEKEKDNWRAYCPLLQKQGASAIGKTKQEAIKNLQGIVNDIGENFKFQKKTIPIDKIEGLKNPKDGAWVPVAVF